MKSEKWNIKLTPTIRFQLTPEDGEGVVGTAYFSRLFSDIVLFY